MSALLSKPLSREREELVITQFAALAQPTRLGIFRELVKVFDCQDSQKGLAAGELAARLALPAPTLSFHLKELTNAGLVASERNGRSIVYRARLDSVRLLIDFMMEDCCSAC